MRLLLKQRKTHNTATMEQTANIQNKKQLPKPNNIITVPYEAGDISFYKWWCILLKPFISLTNKEIEVVANFLYQRNELSKSISDQGMLDTMVMSDRTKNKIIEACNITKSHFYVIMNNLRKSKVIVKNVLNPRLIPNSRKEDNGVFQLLILFKETAA